MTAKRLLMVDDDPAMGDLVRHIAERLGYDVETWTEAGGFKAAVEARDADVIILDLTMPDTDGIELIKHLAGRRSRARIFIMSGFDAGIRRMAYDLGKANQLAMAGIIPKPVRAAELRAMLMPPEHGAAERGEA